jgi:DNA-binding beta-propeller fold protein YncE
MSSTTASFLSGSDGYTVGSLSGPVVLAINLSGNAWVAGGSTGRLLSGGSLSSPSGVAIDASNNAWIANSGNASVTEITPGSTPAYANYTGSDIAASTDVAIDPK